MVVAGLFLGLPGLFLDMVSLILGKALEGSMSSSEDKSSEHFLRCAFSSFSSLLLETKTVPHFQHGLKSISTLAFWEDVGPALTFDNACPAFEEAAFDEAGPGFVEAGPGYEKAAFDEAGPSFLEAGPGFVEAPFDEAGPGMTRDRHNQRGSLQWAFRFTFSLVFSSR